MSMPGLSGHASSRALALVLALFMPRYILWTTDRLATSSRTRATDAVASPVLVPRLAACAKIVMSAAMGYMLVATL
jgi:predicted membrane protein